MLTLAIDTSTETFSLAIGDEILKCEIFLNVGLTHSENILPMIDLLLKKTNIELSQIKRLAVTIGPGSFIGLRIGLTAAKLISNFYGIPMCGISTLDVLASCYLHHKGFVCSLIEAPKNYLYTAIYKVENENLERITKYAFEDINSLIRKLKKTAEKEIIFLAGKTSLKYIDELKELNIVLPNEMAFYPRASNLLNLAIKSKNYKKQYQIKPLYLKPFLTFYKK